MLNKFRELWALNAFAKKQSVGMQRKLMLYWVSMILVVFAAVILLLSIAGAFSQNDEQLHEVMELQLKNTQDSLASRLDRLTAQSLNLSKELSREIEGELVREGISLQEVNDDSERLLKLQQIMYPLVNTTLQTANCNGAYVILNATDRQLQRSLCNFECHGQYHPGGGRPLQKRDPPALHQPQRQQSGCPYRGLLPRYPGYRPAKGSGAAQPVESGI